MAKVLITIPDDFLQSVDRCAAGQKHTRSRFIREALQLYLRRNMIKKDKMANKNAQKLDEMLS